LVGKTRCPVDGNPGCASLRWVRWCKATSIRYFRFGRNPGVIKGKAVRPPRPLVDRINRAGYTNLPDPKGSYTKCQISDVQCIVSGMGRYSYANAEHPRHFVPQSQCNRKTNVTGKLMRPLQPMQLQTPKRPQSECSREAYAAANPTFTGNVTDYSQCGRKCLGTAHGKSRSETLCIRHRAGRVN